jgi:hypothetical protein
MGQIFPACSLSEGNCLPGPWLLWEWMENLRPKDSVPKSPFGTNIFSPIPYHPWVSYSPFCKRHTVQARTVSNSSHSPWHVLSAESARNFHWGGITSELFGLVWWNSRLSKNHRSHQYLPQRPQSVSWQETIPLKIWSKMGATGITQGFLKHRLLKPCESPCNTLILPVIKPTREYRMEQARLAVN